MFKDCDLPRVLLGCCQVRIDEVVGSPSIGVEGSVINGKSNEKEGLLPTAGAEGGGAKLLSCPKRVSYYIFLLYLFPNFKHYESTNQPIHQTITNKKKYQV